MKIVENEYIKFWIDNGILHSEYKYQFEMNLENSEEIYTLRKQISEGKKQYFLYDISNLKSMSKGARDYGSSHGMEDLAASAIIINSSITLLIYNIFIKLKKVEIPVKAFRNKEEAIDWLNKIKKLNS